MHFLFFCILGSTFRFSYSYEQLSNNVRLRYKYRTKKDHVPADGTESYIATVNSISNSLYYSLSWGDEEKNRSSNDLTQDEEWYTNWPLVMFFIFFSGIMAYGVRRAKRIELPSADLMGYYTPIGGWLVLVGVGLGISILLHLIAIAGNMQFFSLSVWLKYTSPGGEYFNAGWAPYIVFRLMSAAGFLAFSILLMILYSGSRTSFPRLFIVFLVSRAGVSIIDYLLTFHFSELNGYYGGTSLITLCIIVPACAGGVYYTLVSDRVKCTFVQRRLSN
jgi:hypothetical protein